MNTLSDTQRMQAMLHCLASGNPDFTAFSAALGLPPGHGGTLPAELLPDIMAVVRDDDTEAAMLLDERLTPSKKAESFAFGDAALGLAAVLFLLRSRIKVHRGADGKWEFLLSYEPGESSPLAGSLERLLQWLKDSGFFS